MSKRTLTQAAGTGVVISSSFPRRRMVFTPAVTLRGRRATGTAGRLKGTISRGYTRRVGFFGLTGKGGSELKFFDTIKTAAIPATGGTILNPSLNLIPQGVTESTRVGRKCVLRSLSIRGSIKLPSATSSASSSDRIRIIVYIDKQTNGATALVGDLLQATVLINQFANLASMSRFTVLCDKMYSPVVHAAAGNGTTNEFGEHIISINYNFKLNLPLEFNLTDGALTTIRSNNIGVMGVTESGLANISYVSRVRFSDG